MAFYGLTFLIQIALVVHVFRTGRPVYWAFVIFFLSAIGAIAYTIVELLPELTGSIRGQRALRSVKKTLNPGAELRQRERQLGLSGSVDAARHLARELSESGRFTEAIEHYENALSGLYEHDPDLLLGLAEAQFGDARYEDAQHTLERLNEHNPDYRSGPGHLLYARTLEKNGDLEAAEHEYAAVARYFAGAEANIRYARLLEQLGREDEALTHYEDVLLSAEAAPRHYRKAQRRWIGEARESVKRIKAD
jgi:hypothetical protein